MLAAQPVSLEQVKEQAESLKQFKPERDGFFLELKSIREHTKGLHSAFRDWIEKALPKTKAELDARLSLLSPALSAELQRAGLIKAGGDFQNFEAGFVLPPEFFQPTEDHKLIVVLGVGLPCGRDDVVYIYDYSQGERRRILESAGTRDHNESVLGVHVSKPSPSGAQQILTLRYAVQCGSSWNRLSYDLFRYSRGNVKADRILAGEHGIWFGDDGPFVRLSADDLLMEMRDRSIDGGIHNRTHVLHFKIEDSQATRADPVALQPQDFVDEWLTRPWSEMSSRSDPAKKESAERTTLEDWHRFLASDQYVSGGITLVQSCLYRAGAWQVGVDLDEIGDKSLPEPLSVYFLAQKLNEPYQFRMNEISFDRQEGCPGDSLPTEDRPTLFPKKK